MKKTELEAAILAARTMGEKYIGVRILTDGSSIPIIAIYHTEEYAEHIRQNLEIYDDNMIVRFDGRQEQITGIAHGDTFGDIEVQLCSVVGGWRKLIADAIDKAYAKMIEQTPPETEEERTRCELIRESVKGTFIKGNRTETEVQFIREHIADYEELFDICLNGNQMDFRKGLAKIMRMQNEFALQQENRGQE